MKKLCCAAAMIMVCLVLLTGCGDYKVSESGTWTDGTYTTKVIGKNGTFEVRVTISDGVMTAIGVGENDETEEIGGEAINQLSLLMIQEQTYDVDVVSGATKTSNALIRGVGKCLEEASKEALS